MGNHFLSLIALAFALCLLMKLGATEGVSSQTLAGIGVSVALIYIMCVGRSESMKRKRRSRRPRKRRRPTPKTRVHPKSKRSRTFYASQPDMHVSETYFRLADDKSRAKKLQTLFGFNQ